jgi:hypothetical protein
VAEFLWLHRAVTDAPSPQPVAGHDVLGAPWAGGARQSRRNANIGGPLPRTTGTNKDAPTALYSPCWVLILPVQADSASKRNGAPDAQRLNQLKKKETERSFLRQLRGGSRLRYDPQSGAKERTIPLYHITITFYTRMVMI